MYDRKGNYFSLQVTNQWNRLPAQIVEAPTTKAFERRLDNFWKEHELIFNYKAETSYSPVGRTSANRRAGENDENEMELRDLNI